MAFFRSEPMTLCQILLHNESAFNCLVELGVIGSVQLRNIYDETAVCNSRYNTDIQRCNELQRMIKYLESEMVEFKIKPVFYPKVDVEELPKATDLKQGENILEEFYSKVTDIKSNVDDLRRRRNFLYEKEQVLVKADEFLTGQHHTESVFAWSDSVVMDLMHDDTGSASKISSKMGFLTGTIETSRYVAFERMVYRVSRGNFYLRHQDISFIQNDSNWMAKRNYKYVFMLFFVGQHLREKLAKVCQGFGIRLFECPETKDERKFMTKQVRREILELDHIIIETEKQQHYLLVIIAADIYIWKVKINKALMVYYVMNHMKRVKRLQMEKYLQTECWIPTSEIKNVRDALTRGVDRTAKSPTVSMFPAMVIELHRKPVSDEEKPVLFRLNRFTGGFQNLIDAYGVAAYRELNPAPYTIVTFPFLFGVMFGDVGHGLIMALFGLFMIMKEKQFEEAKRQEQQPSEIWNIMFGGRYIIFLMGVFSMYTGFAYNDIFSKSLNIFGSHWAPNENTTREVEHLVYYQFDPTIHYKGTPYWFGMDPIWDVAGEHSITTYNSIKMKIAIILGVTQMMFGLMLAATNYMLKKEYSEFFLVFVPQVTFLSCIFCYLVFMIFFKWVHYGGKIPSPYNSACAPSILIIFINMLLMKGSEVPPEGCLVWMYPEQPLVQPILLYTALISVPILLAGRPCFIMYQQRKLRKLKSEEGRLSTQQSTASSIRRTLMYNVESSISAVRIETQEQPEKQDIVEVWIHSGIHCIESVLGSVSHTASYLRLWALSLAHDQLSTVLWDMVLNVGLLSTHGYWNILIISVVFFFWATLTIAILVVMEGLSAFLHTLRLHWVEFQSKFYDGSGVKFAPFAFPHSTLYG